MGKKSKINTHQTSHTIDNTITQELALYQRLENLGRRAFLGAYLPGSLATILQTVNANSEHPWDYSHKHVTVGYLLFLGGAALGHYAQRQVKPDVLKNKLKTDGFYQSVRHPIYGGFRLSSLGMIVAQPTILTALAVAGVFIGTEICAYYEEKKLELQFPGSYHFYRENTPKWIPGLRYRK